VKLLVISHACTTPQNQMFFEKVREISGWNLVIIVPELWNTEYRKRAKSTKLPDFQGRVLPVKVFLSGKIPLHFYHPKLFKVMAAEQPDAIYVHNEPYALGAFQAFLFNRLARRRPIAFYAAQNITKKYPFPISVMERWVFKWADMAYPVTYSAKICLDQKGYTGRSVVLPLGINDIYLDNAPERQTAHPVDVPIIGYVGRLVPEKGVKDLFAALDRIKDRKWICQIVGEGPQKGELLRMAAASGLGDRIVFLGYVDHGEVFNTIKRFAILVLPPRTQPNWKEQFGRVIIEALAAEVPVIGTDCGEIPHLINALEGGRVVKEGDVEELAAALEVLIGDPYQRELLGQTGRANVIRKFSETKIATDFVDAFLKPLAGQTMLPGR